MTVHDPADFTVLSTTGHYRGWVIDVHTDEVRMPDGDVARRDVISHPGAVAVLALDADDRVIMVRQYRHPVRGLLLELPAGILDVDGEPGLLAARRELYEEAALTADQWWVLVDLYTSPGMTDEAIRIYLARGLREVAESERFAAAHEEVTMTVERFSLDELVAMALAGALTNGPAIAGVLAAAAARAGGWQALRPADAAWDARPEHSGAGPA
jgi:8-oxo-dGTP pyrophosphatase MutT (NUDIX family)